MEINQYVNEAQENKQCFPVAQNPPIITLMENVRYNLFCDCQVARGSFAA